MRSFTFKSAAIAASVLVALSASTASAQLSLTAAGNAETIDFTGFDGSGFTPIPAAGQLDSDTWAGTGMSDGDIAFGGTATSGDWARGSSITTTGGVYGADVGAGNIALIIQPGGSDWTPGTLTLRVDNNTGGDLDSFDVAYDIFYNNNEARGNHLTFSWSTDDSTYNDEATLDFTTPEVADALGFQSVNRNITITPTSPIANGASIYFRWNGDDNLGTGSRDEYGLDNISVTGNVAVTAVNTVTVDAGATANGTDTFNTIAAAIASFSTGGNNETVASDSTPNTINVVGGAAPYVELMPNIAPSSAGVFAGIYEGTDPLVIIGDSDTDRPVVRLQDGASGSGFNTDGNAILTLQDLIFAAAETSGMTDDVIYLRGNSTVNLENVAITALPAGNTDGTESALGVSGLTGLVDGTTAYDGTLLRGTADGDGIYVGGFGGTETVTLNMNNSVLTQMADDSILAVADSTVNITNSTISSGADCGIQIGNTSTTTMNNVTWTGLGAVSGNNAPIWSYQTVNDLNLTDVTITDNFNALAALWLQCDGVTVNIDGATITGNASDGIEINNGDGLTTNFTSLFIADNTGAGINVPIDDNDFAGFSNSIIANNAGGNVVLLNGSGTTAQAAITISDSTIYGGSIQLGAASDPFNVASLTITDTIFAGAGTGLDIIDSVITPDVTNCAFVTAGPDALTTDINGTANTSGIVNDDPQFVDAANDDFDVADFAYAAAATANAPLDGGAAFVGVTASTDAASGNLTQALSGDDLSGATAVVLAGSWLSGGDPNEAELTDDNADPEVNLEGLASDNPGEGNYSVEIAYDLTGSASDIANVTNIAVTSGWQDGRAAHHYDLFSTTDYPVDGTATWTPVILGVTPIAFGSGHPNPGTVQYYQTVLEDGGEIASGITGLKFSFYAIGNTSNAFVDQYNNGTPGDVDGGGAGSSAAQEGAWIREIDATFSVVSSVNEWMLLND